MFSVVIDSISSIEILHYLGQVGLACLKKKMVMIAHQTIGIQIKVEFLFGLFKICQEFSEVCFV